MKRIGAALLLTLAIPAVVWGQTGDPIDRRVTDSDLSPSYSGNEKSDFRSNREYAITKAKGNAQNAIGTRFERSSEEFEITSLKTKQETYDDHRGDSYSRVIYEAKKLELPKVDKEPVGRRILVTVDYRPVQVTPPPPPRTYEAYVAEVEVGKEESWKDRWQYVKLGAKR